MQNRNTVPTALASTRVRVWLLNISSDPTPPRGAVRDGPAIARPGSVCRKERLFNDLVLKPIKQLSDGVGETEERTFAV
jgi:hypothetical protein